MKMAPMDQGVHDRLSNLPDEIILRILSFIPSTKHTVQTCILAKRWKNLWTTLPDLHLDSRSFTSYASFANFVSGVSRYRDSKTKVQKCRFFNCWCGFIDPLANKVIIYAISHEVQHLIIQLDDRNYIERRQDLGQSSFLQTYELRHLSPHFSNGFLKFSKLTTLHLEDCLFFDGSISFEHFNFVKNLALVNCHFRIIKALMVKSSYLESFTIVLESDSSARSFEGCKFEIVASKLTCFRWKATDFLNFSSVDLSLIDLPCLQHADVQLFIPKRLSKPPKEQKEKDCENLLKLFEGLHNAQYVNLNSCMIEDLMTADNLLEHKISPFTQLKSLKLKVHSTLSPSSRLVKVMEYLLIGSPFANCILVTEGSAVHDDEVQHDILQAISKAKTMIGSGVDTDEADHDFCADSSNEDILKRIL